MGTINGARRDYIALGPVPALDGPDEKGSISIVSKRINGEFNFSTCAINGDASVAH